MDALSSSSLRNRAEKDTAGLLVWLQSYGFPLSPALRQVAQRLELTLHADASDQQRRDTADAWLLDQVGPCCGHPSLESLRIALLKLAPLDGWAEALLSPASLSAQKRLDLMGALPARPPRSAPLPMPVQSLVPGAGWRKLGEHFTLAGESWDTTP